MDQNPNTDLRRQHGEEIVTEMFQRLQECQNFARKIACENSNKSIEDSNEYFSSKAIPNEFQKRWLGTIFLTRTKN